MNGEEIVVQAIDLKPGDVLFFQDFEWAFETNHFVERGQVYLNFTWAGSVLTMLVPTTISLRVLRPKPRLMVTVTFETDGAGTMEQVRKAWADHLRGELRIKNRDSLVVEVKELP